MHHRLHVITGEAQLVSEKERTNERQLFELGKSDGIFQQLPLRLQGVKLVNELLGICQEVVVVVLVPVKSKNSSIFRFWGQNLSKHENRIFFVNSMVVIL